MIKQSKEKLWQKLAIATEKFWRRFGNPYSRKLTWYCDYCRDTITGVKYLKGKGSEERHYCEKHKNA